MQILTDLESYPPRPEIPLILALGNFDGAHLGHQALLTVVVEKARQSKGRSAALTFSEHPQGVLHPDAKRPLLTSSLHKLFLLDKFGIDLCFLLHFTQPFSRLEPEVFVEEILVKRLGVHEVCLGHNAHFGRDRRGDGRLMRELAGRYGFLFEEMKPVKAAGDYVSSSRIRELVSQGKLEEAAACLGRPFSIFAMVVKGAGRGSKLGSPTANLASGDEMLPPEGVYAVTARVVSWKHAIPKGERMAVFTAGPLGPWIQGVLNYGRRPTFESSLEAPIAEVFLFDFEGDLYEKTLEVVFHRRLRSEVAFRDADALKRQIALDITAARAYFEAESKKTFTKTSD